MTQRNQLIQVIAASSLLLQAAYIVLGTLVLSGYAEAMAAFDGQPLAESPSSGLLANLGGCLVLSVAGFILLRWRRRQMPAWASLIVIVAAGIDVVWAGVLIWQTLGGVYSAATLVMNFLLASIAGATAIAAGLLATAKGIRSAR